MSETAILKATPRLKAGKGPANQSREQGFVPAVIYGDKKTPDLINIDAKNFTLEMHKPGFNGRIFSIEVDGKTQKALPKAVQLHPVSDRPLHVDFLRVSAHTVVHVNVPIKFINEDQSPGLKKGGVLNVVHHDIELVCKADAIPEVLEVDLTGTEIGHAFHLDAIALPAGAKSASGEEGYTIATLLAPRIEVEPTEAAAEEGEEGEDAEKTDDKSEDSEGK